MLSKLSIKKEALINHLEAEGFGDDILGAFKNVKRENFVPINYREFSYDNIALPIGYEQTISQPSTIAFMLSLLEVLPRQKILEIGSGSGYVLALLNELSFGKEIYGVEVIPELVKSSKRILKKYKNIEIRKTNRELGLVSKAPFDRILVSASSRSFPKKLLGQLSENGIIVCPVKNDILKIKKENDNYIKETYPGFIFVPLV